VPPLRAGCTREMEARVDSSRYADPPCVSALLSRCSGTRWWMKESNLRVSPGSHQTCGCVWSEYNDGYRLNPHAIRDTTIRGRRARLRFADRDGYAVGLASGASSHRFLGEIRRKSAHDEYTSGRLPHL